MGARSIIVGIGAAAVTLLACPLRAGEGVVVAGLEGREVGPQESGDGPTVEDFAWMAGHWRGEGLGGICEEIWTGPLGGSMVGLFRLIRDGKLVFTEHQMLVRDGADIVMKVKHFSPEFVSWEDKEGAVRFKLETVRPNEAVFKGMRIRRTSETLEFVIRFKSDAGLSREDTILLRLQD